MTSSRYIFKDPDNKPRTLNPAKNPAVNAKKRTTGIQNEAEKCEYLTVFTWMFIYSLQGINPYAFQYIFCEQIFRTFIPAQNWYEFPFCPRRTLWSQNFLGRYNFMLVGRYKFHVFNTDNWKLLEQIQKVPNLLRDSCYSEIMRDITSQISKHFLELRKQLIRTKKNTDMIYTVRSSSRGIGQIK